MEEIQLESDGVKFLADYAAEPRVWKVLLEWFASEKLHMEMSPEEAKRLRLTKEAECDMFIAAENTVAILKERKGLRQCELANFSGGDDGQGKIHGTCNAGGRGNDGI
jgi:hypothetical protein